MSELVIIDTGGANLNSVRFALERLGVQAPVTADRREITDAKRVLLPGVGHARDSMVRLQDSGLAEIIPGLSQPVLGICLGMQLLFDHSEEGHTQCLSVVPGSVAAMPADASHSVPHMGWNEVDSTADWMPSGHYYFVHSFAAPVGEHTVGTTTHGMPFSSAVVRGNFAGVQFHPERSGPLGARLLKAFLSWDPAKEPAA